ncbi:MAG TPA: hypothetical protein VEI52_03835 [Terriglobales bacterium]|nr:hypothetical protein [Terriglobales bacterium]
MMGPIGHFSVGLAAKPAVPKVPLGVLLLATWILDILAIGFGFAGIEREGSAGLPGLRRKSAMRFAKRLRL